MSPSGRWALTPPFHPYRAPRPLKTCLRFCLRPITEAACAGGFFSVALSVAVPSPARPPGVTRRAARRSPDFPPGTCLAAIHQRSPGPLAAVIIARQREERRAAFSPFSTPPRWIWNRNHPASRKASGLSARIAARPELQKLREPLTPEEFRLTRRAWVDATSWKVSRVRISRTRTWPSVSSPWQEARQAQACPRATGRAGLR
jgi:hypothetical protein